MTAETPISSPPDLKFDNSYARLPDRFYERVKPTTVPEPTLLKLNVSLAEQLGLSPETLQSPAGLAILAGNEIPNDAEPIAAAYAGHQFGNFVPKLGDGRAILLGEINNTSGERRDIQLKGSGPTPFSRRGDGRAALGPVLREYLISEAMAALGIPTTRALAAVATGESVFREIELPGAILTRIAASHIRVGTFQYFASRQDKDGLKALADHVIARHYPGALESKNPYASMLECVIERQAELLSRWLLVGFIHGVMNTDNMSIAGETIDYGPCAFMDTYHPLTVYSSIDTGGRYAFANQPAIAAWNLARLAEAILPLLGDNEDTAVKAAQSAVSTFRPKFEAHYTKGLARKIGLEDERAGDLDLIQDLLDRMAEGEADFTLTFRALSTACDPATSANPKVGRLFKDAGIIEAWLPRWHKRLQDETRSLADRQLDMKSVNPAVIPRNHLVEEVLNAAIFQHDLEPFHNLHEVLKDPFSDQPEDSRFVQPPKPDEIVQATFCGT